MTPKALIVSDYSSTVGGAHLTRDAQLAAKLTDQGMKTTLLVPDNTLARKDVPTLGLPPTVRVLFKTGMTFQPKGADTFSPFPDYVLERLPFQGYAAIVIDSYRATAVQLARLQQRKGIKPRLFVIDDSNARGLDQKSANIIVNVNLPEGAVDYNGAYSIHAPRYHMLKPAFFAEHTRDPNQVFMAFSGLDDGRVSIVLLDALSKRAPDLGHPDLKFKVALKKIAPEYKAAANELIAKYGNRIEFIQRYDGPAIMGQSGLFVGNTGQVSLEAISSGLPIIGLFMLGDRVPTMEKYYASNGVVMSDISNIMASTDRKKEIQLFAADILPMLQKREGVAFQRPDKNGFDNLAKLISSCRVC